MFMLLVFSYVFWCPTQYPYQIMFVSFNSNTTKKKQKTKKPRVSVVEQELITHPEHRSLSPVFIGVRVVRSLVVCVVVCRSSFCMSCDWWPLLLLAIVLYVLWLMTSASAGHCIVCPVIDDLCFCWPLYCMSCDWWPLLLLGIFILFI
jgi:hypothetical protein